MPPMSLISSTSANESVGGSWNPLHSMNAEVPSIMNSLYSATKFKHGVNSSCTEVLGDESGVKYSVNDYNRDMLSTDRQEQENDEAMQSSLTKNRRQRSCSIEFPPPLTSRTRGDSRVHVVSRKVNGRLMLFTVKQDFIEAERKNRRLCLRLHSDKPFGSKANNMEMSTTDDIVGMEMNGIGLNSGLHRRVIGGCKEEHVCGHDQMNNGSNGTVKLDAIVEAVLLVSS